MRILIATDTYPPDLSGSSMFTRRLARDLAALGHEVHVVCSSDDSLNKLVVDQKGVRLHRLASLPLLIHPTVRFANPMSARRRLRSLIASIRPDVLHTQDHFTIGRAAIRAALEAGIPVVATNHFMPQNLTPYTPRPCRPLLTRAAWYDFQRVYRNADRVTAPTPTAADIVRRHGLRCPVEPVSCGVDTDIFHPHGSPSGSRRALALPDLPTIGYVGRLDADKRLDEPLRALARLDGDRSAQLVLAGTGARCHWLERLAAVLGIADRVHFLGFVPDELLPQVYAAFDLFCMPGTAELQSIATLEALASGLPVVLADAVALPHLVEQGVNGSSTHRAASPSSRRRSPPFLVSDRQAMGAVSRQIAERHAAARTVSRFDQIYRQLAESPRTARSRRRP